MPVFNYPGKEVNIKVVYYGPGLSGKTTNIQYIHGNIRPDLKGKLVSLATQTDRTLFFDFLPMELGMLGGYKIRLHLYTVPGQVHYNATRKLVLKGVDGVVLVADSQRAMQETNQESFTNLEKNLESYGKGLKDLPHVIQCNKRDLDDLLSLDELNAQLNPYKAPVLEAIASEGKGVLECLREILRLVMKSLRDQLPPQEAEAEPLGKTPSRTGAEAIPEPEPAGGPEEAPSSLEAEPPDEPPPSLEPEPEVTVALDAPETPLSTERNNMMVRLPIPGGGEMEIVVQVTARLTKTPVSAETTSPESQRERPGEDPPEGVPSEIEDAVLEPGPGIMGSQVDETALADEFDVEEVIAELDEELELDTLETLTEDGKDQGTEKPDEGFPPAAKEEPYDPSFRELQFTDFDGDRGPEDGKGKKKGFFGRLRKKK